MNQDYLKLMSQKIIRHKDNWKDNPNRYTGLFLIITPILNPNQRKEFNDLLKDFSYIYYGLRPESAERICYIYNNPEMRGQRIYVNTRIKNEYGTFDTIIKESLDIVKLERGLRNLSLWLLVTFKEICNEKGLKFEKDEIGISDIQEGASAIL